MDNRPRYWAVTGKDSVNGGPLVKNNPNIRISWAKLQTPEGAIKDTLGLGGGTVQHGLFVKDVGTKISVLRSDKKRVPLLTDPNGYKTLCQWREVTPCLHCRLAIEGEGREEQQDGNK